MSTKIDWQSPYIPDWPEIVRLLTIKRSQRELGRMAGVHHQALGMLRHGQYDDMMAAGALVLLDGFIAEHGADHESVRDLPVVRLLNAQKCKS